MKELVKKKEIKDLAPEFKEIRIIDTETGRVDSYIVPKKSIKGVDIHFHSWTDPSKGSAGGVITTKIYKKKS